MARITVLPESDAVGVVDVRDLLEGRGPLPPVDSKTLAPTGLRSFVVHEDPRMVAVPQFLSPEECRHLCDLAEGGWIRSLVGKFADPAAGKTDSVATTEAQTRTSSSCPLRPAQTAIVHRIEQRLAQLAKLPIETLERLVVVRYEPGQEFTVHHDGKFRPITIFLYLNELPDNSGGDTYFPHLGFSFVPRTGCAVMWPNAQPDGKEDSRMVHAGRPPTVGVKFGVNCFFNIDTKRIVMSPTMNLAASECHRVEVGALQEQLVEVEGTPSVRRRTFTLNTEAQIRAVPNFLTSEEVESVRSLLDPKSGEDATPDFEGATAILKLFPFEEPSVKAIEARLISWNEFAPENLGQLKLVRGNMQMGLGNRGCGQRCASICLSDEASVHFPHLGVQLAMCCGDLVEWPNAWFQEEAGSEKVTVEDLRTSHVYLSDSLMLDVSFHDKSVRPAKAS